MEELINFFDVIDSPLFIENRGRQKYLQISKPIWRGVREDKK